MNIEILLFAIVVIQALVLAYLLARRPTGSQDAASLIKQDIVQLSDNVGKLRDSMQQQITEQFSKSNDQLLKQSAQSSRIVREVTEKLTELDKTNQQVGDIAHELKDLQRVLQNPKQRGVLGEYYLQTVLENVLPKGSFQMQYKFNDGETVDAVVIVDKDKLIPIDSKFSLENYNRLIDAKDKAERDRLSALIKYDLKNRIDETGKYIRPEENTLELAFMFIPSEAVYYDLLTAKVGALGGDQRDLIEYAFRDKKVIIVSPTTLLAYLQTVLQGLRSLQIEGQAKEIQKRVGELGRHMTAHETFMQKLGGSLGTTVNHYNAAHKELGKVDKDIVRIAEKSPGVEPLVLDRPTIDD